MSFGFFLTLDGKTRIIHILDQKVLSEWSPPEGVKDTRVLFLAEDRVLTVGFAAAGLRSMSLWDTSAAAAPKLLQTIELERTPYMPIPRYDPDTKLIFLANAVSGRGNRKWK
jgi:hypothetical protein